MHNAANTSTPPPPTNPPNTPGLPSHALVHPSTLVLTNNLEPSWFEACTGPHLLPTRTWHQHLPKPIPKTPKQRVLVLNAGHPAILPPARPRRSANEPREMVPREMD